MFRSLLITLWLFAVASGLMVMTVYSTKPGNAERTLTAWPESSVLKRPPHTKTVLFYLHPHCPCSHATVRELERVVAEAPHVFVQAICFVPEGESIESWCQGSLFDSAQRLSKSTPFADSGGMEAKRFGISTSGHVMLFDELGNLRFSGGVTSGRGHEGENRGSLALKSQLGTLPTSRSHEARELKHHVSTFLVFGCSINEEQNDD